ncbi:MAG: lipoate--protein ligase [Bacteroidetes bacterium]|nr:lipoate--protein ligase [Bacteroidota bacterium]
MLIISRNSTDPYFNLAAEEYFLKHFTDDCFMLWRNDPSIIVGKHQNTLAEINVDYIKANNIKVVRRLSGGGAVFHDLGNLNFTFIETGSGEGLVDFRKYTLPILEVLQKLGIEARFEGRNDLTIEGKKFSGNAESVWKNRVLHHGTLLFSSKMADLSRALKVNPLKFSDKAVKSVPSRVTNISGHLKEPMGVLDFAKMINDHILEKFPDAQYYDLTQEDHGNIESLVRTKYGTWEWNFGYSPKYNLRKIIRTTSSGTIEVNLFVQNGTITSIRIFGDFFGRLDTDDLEKALTNVPHTEQTIIDKLKTFNIDDYIKNCTAEELIKGFF